MRTSGSARINLETTVNLPEDTPNMSIGIRQSVTSNRGGNPILQTSGANVTLNNGTNSDRPPPAYPCQDVCIQCGKKMSEVVEDNTITNSQQDPDTVSGCQCECHKQTQCEKPLESSDQVLQTHIPPAGPHCLPGCGYSGLPCYNCSLLQTHLQPQAAITQPLASPQSPARTFSPQIYTIELLENSSASSLPSSSPRQATQHQQIVTEGDSNQETKRRKMCFSIVVFVIAINVFIGMFRMLIGERGQYGV